MSRRSSTGPWSGRSSPSWPGAMLGALLIYLVVAVAAFLAEAL
jgi:hypothetical protein